MQENRRNNSIIKQNILHYLDAKGISQYQCYKETGITRGVLSQDNGISEDNLMRFLAHYTDVSTSWLLTGNGQMLIESDSNVIGGKYLEDREEFEKAKELGLVLIPEYTDTFRGGTSGSIIGSDSIKAYWSFPNIKADMIVEVEGDSMANTYPAGSKVAIRKIQFDRQYPTVGIPFGEAFGIIIDNDDENYLTFIKRLRRHPDKELQNKYWIAQSDNKAYDDFEIEISKVRHLFIVVAGVKLTGY